MNDIVRITHIAVVRKQINNFIVESKHCTVAGYIECWVGYIRIPIGEYPKAEEIMEYHSDSGLYECTQEITYREKSTYLGKDTLIIGWDYQHDNQVKPKSCHDVFADAEIMVKELELYLQT